MRRGGQGPPSRPRLNGEKFTEGERFMAGSHYPIPSKGDRIEHRRLGVVRAGCVWYADQLQVLVKWEDGTSSTLRIGRDPYVVPEAAPNGAKPTERVEHLPGSQAVPTENGSRRRVAAGV
jgi:hypothetical protein